MVKSPERFSLDPALQLVSGSFHEADKPIFGAMDDSSPDRWGEVINAPF